MKVSAWEGGKIMDVKIAVKELAAFVCQSGDLTSSQMNKADLIAGTKIHQMIQSKYPASSLSEQYIKEEFSYHNHRIFLHGFIDGILEENDETIIDEIKSTNEDLEELTEESHPEYLAQVKLYGYLYALQHEMKQIHLRLTYVSVVDYEIRKMDFRYEQDELEEFCFSLLEEYLRFREMFDLAQKNRQETIQTLKFPYDSMRQGQRDMMKACFQAMKNQEILYCIAPTGIGKTIATMFSSLKTLKEKEKLFYLTAKGSGKNAPLEAMKRMNRQGLKIKTIDITAKKKICNSKSPTCHPEECPYAKGYYDRVRETLEEIFEQTDIFDADTILQTTNRHRICAFEFSLYLSYFCDVVISDYNYVFDPRVHLIRYFDTDDYQAKVLVDEAHNLVSRGKEMYSSALSETTILNLRKRLTGIRPSIRTECNKVLDKFESVREWVTPDTPYCSSTYDQEWTILLKHVIEKCDWIFEENPKMPHKEEVWEEYFKIVEFLGISQYFSYQHRFLIQSDDQDGLQIQMMCLDASDFLLQTIHDAISGIVFFSATLSPISYYAQLLTQGEGKFLELPSPFPKEHLKIVIHQNISTKYRMRIHSVDEIIETIRIVTQEKPGNYIAYFPSYRYLKMVTDCLDEEPYRILIQKAEQTEEEKVSLLKQFQNTDECKVGFFVMGGLYSEGVDFIGDLLSGVIVIGVGLPQLCFENNILKEYFDQKFDNGFDYAYTYPGFTKVIQAVGRVIRSETDYGIAILMDERFGYEKYQNLMPSHWEKRSKVENLRQLRWEVRRFWQNKKEEQK